METDLKISYLTIGKEGDIIKNKQLIWTTTSERILESDYFIPDHSKDIWQSEKKETYLKNRP